METKQFDSGTCDKAGAVVWLDEGGAYADYGKDQRHLIGFRFQVWRTQKVIEHF